MRGDVIRLARFVSVDFFQNKIVRFFLYLTAFVIAILQITQTFLFLQKFEIFYFVQYAPAYIMMFYILACLTTIPYTCPIVLKACQYMRELENTAVDPRIEKRFLKQAKYVKLSLIFFITLTLTSSVFHIIPNLHDKETYFYFMILENYLPEKLKVYIFLVRTQFPLVALAMMAPYTQLIYVCLHARFYYDIFLHDLKKVEGNLKIHDKKFNVEIKKRLLSCTVRHRNFYNAIKSLAKKIQYVIFTFFVTGSCLVISLIFACLSFQKLPFYFWARLGTLSLATLLLGVYVVFVGQSVENMTSETFEILKMYKWYNWNTENKKIYLFFLTNAQRPLKLQFSENLCLNYELGLKVTKFLFSMISILRRVNNVK